MPAEAAMQFSPAGAGLPAPLHVPSWSCVMAERTGSGCADARQLVGRSMLGQSVGVSPISWHRAGRTSSSRGPVDADPLPETHNWTGCLSDDNWAGNCLNAPVVHTIPLCMDTAAQAGAGSLPAGLCRPFPPATDASCHPRLLHVPAAPMYPQLQHSSRARPNQGELHTTLPPIAAAGHAPQINHRGPH